MTVLDYTAPVTENIERPETLSRTGLGFFDRCPRSFYLLRKHGTVPSQAMDRGTVFHLTVERCIGIMQEQEEQTIPGEVARDICEAVIMERTDLSLSAAEQDAARLMVWNWATATVLDLDAIVGVEMPISMELGGWTLTGRIDRAEVYEGVGVARDYKTSLALPNREEVQRGWPAPFYSLLLAEGIPDGAPFPVGRGLNDFNYVEEYPRYTDKDSGALVTRTAVYSRPELAEFKQTVLSHLERIDSYLADGSWPARPGSHCGICPAASECPIPAELRPVDTIETLADAEENFKRLLFLDAEKARVQKSAREWTKENGPTYVGDFAFDATYSESKSVKDWDQLEAAIQRSVDLGEPFDRDAHIKVRSSTKFGKRKLTEEERDD